MSQILEEKILRSKLVCVKQGLSYSIATTSRTFFATRYDFFPFFPRAGLPGAGSGCFRFRYHCWPIPTTLLVRIYTAKPLG